MAEVTIVSGPTVHNYGDQVAVTARVSVAATGDVWTPNLRVINTIMTPPRTDLTDVAKNDSEQVVFTTGAAVSNIDITVVGEA